MHFLRTLTNLALFSASTALAYTTVAQLEADITILDNSVKDLIVATQAYNGGLLTTVPPVIDFTVVEAKLTKGVTDSRLLPPQTLSESDTQSLIDLVSNTLAIDNPKAVSVLKSKKALIDANGGTAIVEAGLRSLLMGHLDLSEQVTSRSPTDKLAQVQNVVNIITVALQDGVNTFAS